MKRLLLTTIATLCIAAPVLAQVAPPKPTEDRLAAVYKEDQLNDPKCGVPRNAGDDYRPTPATPDQTRAPRMTTKAKYQVDVVVSGIVHPWGFAFLPSGSILVAVRGDGLRVVGKDGKLSDVLPGTPKIENRIRLFGMHDVILDKDFAKNRTIYMAYATTPEGQTAPVGYIVSAKLAADEKSVTDLKILKQGALTPRRIVQAADGTLYALTIDIVTPYVLAQNKMSLQGKVLRINTDGSIPKDNPFVNDKDADPAVYALGIRDPQGITFQPGTSNLWIVENEPRGGDELNLIKAGKNYGFPVISYGHDNDGKTLGEGKTAKDGMEQPVYFWTPSVATSGAAFYTGSKFPEWKGDFFLGGMSGMQLIRLKLNAEGHVVSEEKLLRDRCKRIKDVRMGPDGLLYVLTDEDNSEIWRISPAK